MSARDRQPTPFDGPGWWNRINRTLFPFFGPSQLGAGRAERPYEKRELAACPVCAAPMSEHSVTRGAQGRATRLVCPRA